MASAALSSEMNSIRRSIGARPAVRVVDDLIFVSDLNTGLWILRMEVPVESLDLGDRGEALDRRSDLDRRSVEYRLEFG